MSIENYLKTRCTDTAVYWGSPTVALDGSNNYVAPIEIKVLWIDEIKMIRDSEGKEIISNATVHVLQDIENHGMLFHGMLPELSTSEKADPKTKEDAYEVKLFIKTPSIHLKGQFSRKVML